MALTATRPTSNQGLLYLFDNNIRMQNISWLDILGQFILPADQRCKQGNILPSFITQALLVSKLATGLAGHYGWSYGIEHRFDLRMLKILNILELSFCWI